MKKFKEIYSTYAIFEEKVIDIINVENNNPWYLNDISFDYTNENMYNQLIRAYGEDINSFDRESDFENSFLYKYQDAFLTFYNKITTNNSLELNKITKEFYLAINKHSSKGSSDSSNESNNVAADVPNNVMFKDMLDDIQITNADRNKAINIMKNSQEDLSSVENNYRIYKMNQTALFKVETTAFINSFSSLFSRVVKAGTNTHEDDSPRFLSGEFVEDVPYLGTKNEQDIIETQEVIGDLVKRVVEFGVPKHLYNDIDNVYQLLSQVDIHIFDGLTKEETYYAIYASNTLWNPDFTYRYHFVCQFTSKEGQLKWALSLIDGNIGNDPADGGDAWYVYPGIPIDVSTIIAQLKPFIKDEIENQIEALPTIEVYSKEEIDKDFGRLNNTTVQIYNDWKSTNTFSNIFINGELYTYNQVLIGGGANFRSRGTATNLTNPVNLQDAATKKYVDDNKSPDILPLNNRFTGSNQFDVRTTHTGGANMNNQTLFNVGNPTNPGDGANKRYVDERILIVWQDVTQKLIYLAGYTGVDYLGATLKSGGDEKQLMISPNHTFAWVYRVSSGTLTLNSGSTPVNTKYIRKTTTKRIECVSEEIHDLKEKLTTLKTPDVEGALDRIKWLEEELPKLEIILQQEIDEMKEGTNE